MVFKDNFFSDFDGLQTRKVNSIVYRHIERIKSPSGSVVMSPRQQNLAWNQFKQMPAWNKYIVINYCQDINVNGCG